MKGVSRSDPHRIRVAATDGPSGLDQTPAAQPSDRDAAVAPGTPETHGAAQAAPHPASINGGSVHPPRDEAVPAQALPWQLIGLR